MGPYSIYDYLTFIFPGATVLLVTEYGWFGWRWHDPGGTALVGILAAAFVVGNVIAGISTWIEPVFFHGRPGSNPDGLWGQFGRNDRHASQRDAIEALFHARYGSNNLANGYALARTEVRNSALHGEGLKTLNQQIGFYRGMTVAALAAAILEIAFAIGWHTHLFPGVWIPVLLGSFLVFLYRYRRFWRWYGDYVIRVIQLLQAAPPRPSP